MIGKQILNYEIKSLIGKGGMGDVYLAEHTSIGRKAAIKILKEELSRNEEIRKRFKNEAKVMARLQHPNIVALYDFHEDEEGLYLIMEYVEGEELAHKIERLDAPMDIHEAKGILSKVLDAFSYAHDLGIVHRDVKPSNILIDKAGNVKVLDFGIAKIVGNEQFNLTKEGSNVGTTFYMSPEQVKAGEIDKRSDIYSLGVTFYEMLAGFLPYKSLTTEYQIYSKIVEEPFTSLVSTMGDDYAVVWAVISKATEKKPDNRYSSCQEMKKDLMKREEVSTSRPVKERQPEKTVPEPQKKSSFPLKTVLAIVIAGVIISIFIVLQNRNQETNPQEENSEIIGDESGFEGEDPGEAEDVMEAKTTVTASSTMGSSAGLSYRPENSMDANLQTWWSPKTDQAGSKWIKYDFGKEKYISGIRIHAGSHYPNFVSNGRSYGNLYRKNLRVRRARLEFSDGSFQYVDLRDVDAVQDVYLDQNALSTFVKVILVDYYPHVEDGWDDYCISEFDIIEGR